VISHKVKQQGYTLIELTLVIMLVGLMMGLSVPRIRSLLITDNLKSSTLRIIGLINELRNDAVRENKVYFLHVNMGSNLIWVGFEGMSQEESELARKNAFQLSQDVSIVDVWRMDKDKKVDGEAIVRISCKGYLEYSIIHLEDDDGREFSIVLQPFLGNIKSYDRYVENRDI
jgi:prepilin-type N-terminal cleavage/methylation domain-containing protein